MSRAMTALVVMMMLTAGAAGCSDGSTDPQTRSVGSTVSPSTPDSTASEQGAAAVPEEIQGTWLLDVDRAAIETNLEKAGYGKIVDRFVKSEGLAPGRTTLTLTLSPDYFEIAWLLPDQTWDVGWYGPATTEGEVLHLDDAYYEGVRDSFTWSVDEEGLSLHFEESSVAKVRGLPSESYSAAYFSKPWAQADCTPEDLNECL